MCKVMIHNFYSSFRQVLEDLLILFVTSSVLWRVLSTPSISTIREYPDLPSVALYRDVVQSRIRILHSELYPCQAFSFIIVWYGWNFEDKLSVIVRGMHCLTLREVRFKFSMSGLCWNLFPWG